MLMFPFHIAYALNLIALTAGTALYAWVACKEGKGTCFAKAIGIIVIILSILSLICTVFYGVKYWKAGLDKAPLVMMQEMMQDMHKKKSMTGNNMETSNTMDQKMTNQKTTKKQKNTSGH